MHRKLTYRQPACVISALWLAVAAGTTSAQQDYPSRPLRFLVGAAPGGATEILARAIGTKMGENLRQQVVIDTRPGANHIIAGELTAKAPPDGYTIQMIPEGFVITARSRCCKAHWERGLLPPNRESRRLCAAPNREGVRRQRS